MGMIVTGSQGIARLPHQTGATSFSIRPGSGTGGLSMWRNSHSQVTGSSTTALTTVISLSGNMRVDLLGIHNATGASNTVQEMEIEIDGHNMTLAAPVAFAYNSSNYYGWIYNGDGLLVPVSPGRSFSDLQAFECNSLILRMRTSIAGFGSKVCYTGL